MSGHPARVGGLGPRCPDSRGPLVEVVELRVPVGVLLALKGFDIALRAEAFLAQEVAHRPGQRGVPAGHPIAQVEGPGSGG